MEKKSKIILHFDKPDSQNTVQRETSVSSAVKRGPLSELASEMIANKRFSGKKCVLCHGEIKIGQKIILCSECKTTSHKSCWDKNGGCGVYGCTEAAQQIEASRQNDHPPIQHLPSQNKIPEHDFFYANFWDRLAAYVIDTIILLFPVIIANIIFNFWVGSIITWLYFSLMESSTEQATLGKKLMGFKITDLHGKRISFGRASGRFFAKIISTILLGVGFLMVAFTKKKQGLHDMMAECISIKNSC